MARVTVFGAGAMGTAFAMHSARLELDTALWANPFDARALETMRSENRHPALPEHLPPGVALHAADALQEAASGCEVAVVAANSAGARSLAQMIAGVVPAGTFVVSVAKGLEPDTGMRMSEVYSQELPGAVVVSVTGPCLAAELAEGLPTAVVWGAADAEQAREAGERFVDRNYQIEFTDDVLGLELCSVLKNAAAIGVGMLDGMAQLTHEQYSNAKAALFTRAVRELVMVITALGGRAETVTGLAGMGDLFVTSLGGRNRIFGERVGGGARPEDALEALEAQGMTVEGMESARDVARLAEKYGLEAPYHHAVHRVLFEGAPAREILEVLL
jgi:glycerol-3-phosphate dehydrogenase (NAD(P)+)